MMELKKKHGISDRKKGKDLAFVKTAHPILDRTLRSEKANRDGGLRYAPIVQFPVVSSIQSLFDN